MPWLPKKAPSPLQQPCPTDLAGKVRLNQGENKAKLSGKLRGNKG